MNQTKAKFHSRACVLCAFFLLISFLGIPPLIAQNTPLTINLQAAVDSALNNNSQVNQYRQIVRQKEYLIKAAKGNYFPSINANAGYTYLNRNPEINMSPIKNSLNENMQQISQALAQGGAVPANMLPILGSLMQTLSKMPLSNIVIDKQEYPNLNITAIQPIYSGGKITASLRFARADAESARLELKEVENKLTRETIKNYYAVALLKQVVKTRLNVLGGMRKHESQAEKAYKLGIINKQELLRAKVAVANAERDLSDDQNKQSLALMALKTNMGLKPDIPLTLTNTLKFMAVPLNLENLQQDAKLYQPVFKLIDQQENMVKQKKAVDRSAFLPQIAAWGEYSAFQDQYPVIMPPVSVGIQAKINLFNGFKKINRIKATRHLQKQIINARKYANEQIDLWINQSYRKALDAKDRYLKMKPTLALSSENLKITEKRFQEGLSKSIDVIDARLLDEKIRIERLHSLYNYNLALADIYLATGQAEKAVEILSRNNQNNK